MVMGEAVLRDRVIPLQRSEIRGKRGRGGEEKKKNRGRNWEKVFRKKSTWGKKKKKRKKKGFWKRDMTFLPSLKVLKIRFDALGIQGGRVSFLFN